jgi:hypothetical protein
VYPNKALIYGLPSSLQADTKSVKLNKPKPPSGKLPTARDDWKLMTGWRFDKKMPETKAERSSAENSAGCLRTERSSMDIISRPTMPTTVSLSRSFRPVQMNHLHLESVLLMLLPENSSCRISRMILFGVAWILYSAKSDQKSLSAPRSVAIVECEHELIVRVISR